MLSGIVYGEAWFMPGGKNYAARLLADAGGNYLWKETDENGFLELSFESVYEKAKDANLWIGVGSFSSMDEIKAADSRYALFKPFTDKQVYTDNALWSLKAEVSFWSWVIWRPDPDFERLG
ncbi:MAG: hypothetical protein U5K54_21985 [Cytophagales bacterium]|nr:hypothetical protein [Cytophagales bacterium]